MKKPASLAEQLAQVPVTRKGPRCGVGLLLERLPEADRAGLLAAFADPQATGPWISKILTENGHKISVCQIGRHRRGECACP